MNRLRISVTEDDIAGGLPCNRWACPLARAIRRITGVDPVVVGRVSIYVDYTVYRTSRSAQRFIDAVDNGQPVLPTNFIFQAATQNMK